MSHCPCAADAARAACAPYVAAIALAAAILSAGCATKLERPVAPFESKVIEVAPNTWYESCVTLLAGDRFLFSYLADPPMAFAIRRRIGNSMVSYLVRDLAREEGGIFFVPESNDYCLHWTPAAAEVTWPTLLRYTIKLNEAKR